MARNVTIAELEHAIRWQADQERAVLRHSSADIRRVTNNSIQRFREIISDNGHPYFLKSFSGTLDVGAGRDTNGQVLAWGILDTSVVSPEVVRVYGLDVQVNSVTAELDSVEFRQRNFYQYGNYQTSIPVAFFGYDEKKIGILPPPDRAYNYTLWYLPVLPQLLADEDEFNPGIPGAEEWVIWDVMHKILNRDNYPRLLASVKLERDELMTDIQMRASSHQRTGPPKRIDTRGRTREKNWFFYRQWLLPGGNSGG
jgi:hypothetical protein